ncbi:hypothetical protein C0993_000023 [Termitomyces sp. T159_Od127]|nr:hypothetical protein C0993_000023 [Termitomyces sp. T159_Od127]
MSGRSGNDRSCVRLFSDFLPGLLTNSLQVGQGILNLDLQVVSFDILLQEDHEIFDLVSELEAAEGKGTTFYSWLNVPSTASVSEISKAYRKMSMQLHPDKNPDEKDIHKRFARLGVVATILRNPESRKRYDFFYKNGVPKWRGTGYYYSRFRPGLGTVVVFLVILTSGLHLLVQKMNYKKDLERIDRIRQQARTTAWGPKAIPLEGQRKVKVNLSGEESTNNRWIDLVVEGQNVYILDSSGNMEILDASAATPPSVYNTWFIALIMSLVRKVIPAKTLISEQRVVLEDDDVSSIAESDSGRSSVQEKENGMKVTRPPTTMAGGKRRKGVGKKR